MVIRTARATRDAAVSPILLVSGVGAALLLRVAIGTSSAALSVVSTLAFSIALLLLAVNAGWRPSWPSLRGIALGLGGAAIVVGFSLSRLGILAFVGHFGPNFVVWVMVVMCVATTEEIVIRGVLLDSLSARLGDVIAIAATALVFALIHLPLYGWPALPLDFAVGVMFAGLRLTGGLSAAVTAHCGADFAAAVLI